MKLIDKTAVVEEIDRLRDFANDRWDIEEVNGVDKFLDKLIPYINSLKEKEVDLEKESELIANGIMISVQSNKYGTNIYNTERNDFNHYHLQMAARKGIELGIKIAQKGK